MIRALIWKEYREHRAIWLTLAFVSGGGLYGLSYLMGPIWGLSFSGARESLMSVAVLFAWTYGLVCGAMLLANENEASTMTFLDILPVWRIQLWLIKCLFGALLLLAQVAVLTGFVIALHIVETPEHLILLVLGMLFSGFFSMSWSLLFSARGENVLNVIALAFIGQIAGIVLTSFLILFLTAVLMILWGGDGEIARSLAVCLGAFGLTVGPAVGSARLFTRLDRERHRAGATISTTISHLRKPAAMSAWASWKRLLWLSTVQMRRMLLGMIIFALALGCFLPVIGPMGWPVLSLVIGVLCGVTVWSDEQLSASFRFLGDQRFPLGRVWLVKVGTRLALAVFAAFLLLLPSLVLAGVHRFSAPARDEYVPFFTDLLHCSLVGPVVPVFSHLVLWLLYGFTAGQLCGMLFRKSLVAGVVALGSAGMLACLWVPSMLGIGLHFWQVAGVPLGLLAASWLLMPAWTSERLLARRTFVQLGSVLLAAGVWTAGGLWYRVAEIPYVPEPFDTQAFAASIPSMDPGKNDAGLAIRLAWSEVDKMAQTLHNKRADEPLFPGKLGEELDTFNLENNAALEQGWPNNPSDLGNWLDEKFAMEWYCSLLEVGWLPIGVVEDARLLTFFDPLARGHNWRNLIYLNQILAVRGLQRQSAGDHWTFVNNLRSSLALSRNLQHRAPPLIFSAGRNAEMIGVAALDRWLEKLPNYPDLLEHTRDILLQHEAQRPEANDPNVASYLIAQNTLAQVPEKLVNRQIEQIAAEEHATRGSGGFEQRKTEVEAAALFWRIPWEHQRHQRIVRYVFSWGDKYPRPEYKKWGAAALTHLRLWIQEPEIKLQRDLALLHAAQIKVALRLYQAKNHGKLPQKLDELVPRYLPSVPLDPFDDKPFRYRLAKNIKDNGEYLLWYEEKSPLHPPAAAPRRGPAGGPGGMIRGVGLPPPATKFVPAGQAILWSVGEDKHDDGGLKHQGFGDMPVNSHPDLIYLVPPPPR